MSAVTAASTRAPKNRASSSRTSALSLADRATWNGVHSVLRMEILEAIRANGPLTVPDLGEMFQHECTGLYYHIRLLQKAGLIHVNGTGARESFTASQSSVRLKLNSKNAKEAKRMRKLVNSYVAASQLSFAEDSAASGNGLLLRSLRWENLDAGEVVRIKKLQKQIESILDHAKARRGRAKKVAQTRANWHVGSFIQPVCGNQYPVTTIECVGADS